MLPARRRRQNQSSNDSTFQSLNRRRRRLRPLRPQSLPAAWEHSTTELVTSLIEYCHQSASHGLLLPITAAAWLSRELFDSSLESRQSDRNNESYNPLDESVATQLKADWLTRIARVQLTRDPWPFSKLHRFGQQSQLLESIQGLIQHPAVDLYLFPNCRVLILDDVQTLNFCQNWTVLSDALQVLHVTNGKTAAATVEVSTEQGSFFNVSFPNLRRVTLSHGCCPSNIPLNTVFPNVESLTLPNNHLSSSQQQELLANLPQLIYLDVSYNSFTTLDHIHYYVGNLQTLCLSHNQLETTEGIDRLYALQSLYLNHNRLTGISAVSGLARLPELRVLTVQGNPHVQRLGVWELFVRNRRRTLSSSQPTYRDLQQALPVIDDHVVTLKEMQTILYERSYREVERVLDVSTEAGVSEFHYFAPRGYARPRRRPTPHCAPIDTVVEYTKVPSARQSADGMLQADFTLVDAILSLMPPTPPASDEEEEGDVMVPEDDVSQEAFVDMEDVGDKTDEPTAEEEREIVSLQIEEPNKLMKDDDQEDERKVATRELQLLNGHSEPSEKKDNMIDLQTLTVSPIKRSDSQRDLMLPPAKASDHDNQNDISIESGRQQLSVVTDTQVVDEPPTITKLTPNMRQNADIGDAPGTVSPARLPISLSGLLNSDDHSLFHGSNGTPLREDASSSSLRAFRMAEENATFDAPHTYKNINVYADLELYFRLFVFPAASYGEEEISVQNVSQDGAEWRMVLRRYPKIQLWPVDRKICDIHDDIFLGPAEATEQFRLVWKEKVVACGKSALRRLTPSRGARYGFHGELLWTDANSSRLKLDTVVESRKVIMCCSNTSIYFILSHDKVTAKSSGQKRTFPLPIPIEARFKDAVWPHALAKHPFSSLRVITIGFGFQRLTLRFGSSALPDKNDFTYVLLTSNKSQTVSLLKEFQDLSQDSRQPKDRFALPEDPVIIENDDRHVLDALGVAVAPDILGVVLHYQVLEQRWRRGERGNVRRVFVLTDSKIYLLDEDYVGDGSETVEAGARQLGETMYRLVDTAPLSQVAQVQAADTDPNAITVVVRAVSSFQRNRNWRLVCRDGNGAEQLVDSVRRALDAS